MKILLDTSFIINCLKSPKYEDIPNGLILNFIQEELKKKLKQLKIKYDKFDEIKTPIKTPKNIDKELMNKSKELKMSIATDDFKLLKIAKKRGIKVYYHSKNGTIKSTDN